MALQVANKFLIKRAAFPDVNQALDCGWFDEVTSGSLDIQWNALGHNIMARVALYRLQHGQRAEAEAILLRGLAAGTHQSVACWLLLLHVVIDAAF